MLISFNWSLAISFATLSSPELSCAFTTTNILTANSSEEDETIKLDDAWTCFKPNSTISDNSFKKWMLRNCWRWWWEFHMQILLSCKFYQKHVSTYTKGNEKKKSTKRIVWKNLLSKIRIANQQGAYKIYSLLRYCWGFPINHHRRVSLRHCTRNFIQRPDQFSSW